MASRTSVLTVLVFGAFLFSLSPTLCSDETSVVSDMTPTAEALSKLGEKYRGEGFSIYPPKELKFAGTRKVGGLQSHGWTHPDGIGLWNFSVTTTRSAKPSKENLEKTEAGMKESLSAASKKLTFQESESGCLHGIDIRCSSFAGVLNDIPFKGLYMIGIDAKGTFSATILIPEEHANDERLQEAKAAILSFERSK